VEPPSGTSGSGYGAGTTATTCSPPSSEARWATAGRSEAAAPGIACPHSASANLNSGHLAFQWTSDEIIYGLSVHGITEKNREIVCELAAQRAAGFSAEPIGSTRTAEVLYSGVPIRESPTSCVSQFTFACAKWSAIQTRPG
jgi:hypothetical protein